MDQTTLRKQILEVLPKDANVSKVEFLGPEIYIYTKNIKLFYETDKYISELAFNLKKRVNIRADSAILADPVEAKEKIQNIIPSDAGVSAIYFDNYFSEVVIEAFKPGLVIGKGGQTTKEIINTTGWTPNIIRAPSGECKSLGQIRTTIYKHSKERKENYAEVAKHIYTQKKSDKDWIRVCPLGGYREVGRSAILVETANSKVLLDCGTNVADSDNAYPMLEVLGFPINEINAIIIGHAHIDHSGFLPYLYKMGYKGPVYCTAPTRDIMVILQTDFINVASKEGKEAPYSEADVREMLKHVITRDYGEVTDITPDMRLTFHNAAHILGSASVHLHIGDGAHNIMYSGDIKFGFTRMFNNMEANYPRLETLLLESTYGDANDVMPQRNVAEERLIAVINETVEKGGNVLIPVFGVGRSQEVMLVLEEYYRRNRLKVKNVYMEGMIKDVCAVHTVYPEYLRANVQKRILQNNSPFSSPLFKTIDCKADRDELLKNSGNVILATSGMMTGGPSLEYFYRMASDAKNTLIFVGYQGDGSLGRKLQSGIKEIPLPNDKGKLMTAPINLNVVTIEGFSGHSDRNQLLAYVSSLNPMPKKILVGHGEKEKAIGFAKFLSSKFKVNATAPKVLDCVRVR